ncbi:MAG: HPr family phosphocarrier protein [Tissierellia bacterium]|nr:HPr family phosphocarrier protein [Tissierellia bacterium]
MREEKVKINLEVGLHARPAAIFVQKSSKFLSDIYLELGGKKVDGKSIIGVMSLGAARGQEVKLITKGEDEEEAMSQLKEFLESDFGD